MSALPVAAPVLLLLQAQAGCHLIFPYDRTAQVDGPAGDMALLDAPCDSRPAGRRDGAADRSGKDLLLKSEPGSPDLGPGIMTVSWARSFGGAANDIGQSLALGKNGLVYLVGYVVSPVTVSSKLLPQWGVGNSDVIILGLDSKGQDSMAETAGGAKWDHGLGLALDASDNLYLTGDFQESFYYRSQLRLTGKGQYSAFALSLDKSGTYRWSTALDSDGSSWGTDVSTSGQSAVVVGYFENNLLWTGTTMTSKGLRDIFISEHKSSTGTTGSVYSMGSSGADEAWALDLDTAGNPYLAGHFDGKLQAGTFTVNSNGVDIFLAHSDLSLNTKWARKYGGAGVDKGWDVAVDAWGNAFLTGEFTGSTSFGSTTLTAKGTDIFLAKVSAQGTCLWAKGFGASKTDEGRGVAVDQSGNVHVTGSFQDAVDFGGGALTSKGQQDVFVASFTADGLHRYSTSLGGTEPDMGEALAVDQSGNVYVSGAFSGSATFGSVTLSAKGYKDIFLVKLSP